MPRVADRVPNQKIYEYIKKYGPVTSSQVREKFQLAPPTFYTKLKEIVGLKVTPSCGKQPMVLEIDCEATT